MVATPREVLQRRAELGGVDDSEVNPNSRPCSDAGFGTPGFDGVCAVLPVEERVDNRLTVVACGQHVHVADGLAPAAVRPREFGGLDGLALGEILAE